MRPLNWILFLSLPFLLATQSSGQPVPNVRAWRGTNDISVPPDLTNAVAVAAGGGHCLALRSDGSVFAWGDNTYGQTTVPPDLKNVVAVAGAARFSAALQNNGMVVLWGDSRILTDTGMRTNTLTNIVAIAGSYGLAAIRTDGTLVASGPLDRIPTEATNLIAISIALFQAVAIKADNTIVAWRDDACGCYRPALPQDLTNIVAVAARGDYGFAALRPDGSIVDLKLTTIAGNCGYCGYQYAYEYGPAPFGNDIIGIAAGSQTIAVRSNGTLVAWPDPYVPPDLPFVRAVDVGEGGTTVALIDNSLPGSPPTIMMQPAGLRTGIGSSALFRVYVGSYEQPTYQWYFNGTNAISGATNAMLVVTNLHAQDSGAYSVKVSNGAGTRVSDAAVLEVLPLLVANIVPAISITGELGFTYRIEYVNGVGLTNVWTPLDTIKITNQPQYYFDLTANGSSQRLYRLVQVP
jgi:hypothetical protein